ncbi:hypothetical protein J2TS4_29920 [Paenibacillus sp. J2TS4]|nr:tetratricopeptide repeat protein [Paenibacillus sp. J2TS4]GIP33782.1 hypothetical protein J2TS4_29920 [Paenibacillus sp. J2TS4]
MRNIFVFALLWWLIGNPFLAVIILLVVLYLLDRKFLGLAPSITKPFRQNRRLRQLQQELRLQPHQTSGKLEAAHLLIGKKKYREALSYLQEIEPIMEESADVQFGIGMCQLNLGELEEGERHMLRSLELNPRVRYGEPYLRLGEAFADTSPDKALAYLEQFREVHSSSCEAYYRLGQLYERLGRQQEARKAYVETLDIYRGLPKYKKRLERRWALLAKLKGG